MQKKPNFDANYSLSLKPQNNTLKEYGFFMEYTQKNRVKRYHGKVSVKYFKNKQNTKLVEIHQGELYINNNIPDLQVEKIADIIRNSLNPIVFSLNEDGSLHNVENLPTIRRKYFAQKNSILKKYTGVSVKLFDQMEENMTTSHRFTNLYKEHPIFKLLFLNLYQTYTARLFFKEKKSFPPIKDSFYYVQSPMEQLTRTNKINLIIKGSTKEIETYNDLLELKTKKKSDLDFKVKLDNNTHMLYSLEGCIMTGKEKMHVGIYEQEKSFSSHRTKNPNNIFINEKPLQKTAMPTQKDKDSKNPSLWEQIKNYRYKK